jgi:hypothetical protein
LISLLLISLYIYIYTCGAYMNLATDCRDECHETRSQISASDVDEKHIPCFTKE